MVLALEKGLGEEAAGHCAGVGREGRGCEEVAQEDAELAVLTSLNWSNPVYFSFLGISNQKAFFQHFYSHDCVSFTHKAYCLTRFLWEFRTRVFSGCKACPGLQPCCCLCV